MRCSLLGSPALKHFPNVKPRLLVPHFACALSRSLPQQGGGAEESPDDVANLLLLEVPRMQLEVLPLWGRAAELLPGLAPQLEQVQANRAAYVVMLQSAAEHGGGAAGGSAAGQLSGGAGYAAGTASGGTGFAGAAAARGASGRGSLLRSLAGGPSGREPRKFISVKQRVSAGGGLGRGGGGGGGGLGVLPSGDSGDDAALGPGGGVMVMAGRVGMGPRGLPLIRASSSRSYAGRGGVDDDELELPVGVVPAALGPAAAAVTAVRFGSGVITGSGAAAGAAAPMQAAAAATAAASRHAASKSVTVAAAAGSAFAAIGRLGSMPRGPVNVPSPLSPAAMTDARWSVPGIPPSPHMLSYVPRSQAHDPVALAAASAAGAGGAGGPLAVESTRRGSITNRLNNFFTSFRASRRHSRTLSHAGAGAAGGDHAIAMAVAAAATPSYGGSSVATAGGGGGGGTAATGSFVVHIPHGAMDAGYGGGAYGAGGPASGLISTTSQQLFLTPGAPSPLGLAAQGTGTLSHTPSQRVSYGGAGAGGPVSHGGSQVPTPVLMSPMTSFRSPLTAAAAAMAPGGGAGSLAAVSIGTAGSQSISLSPMGSQMLPPPGGGGGGGAGADGAAVSVSDLSHSLSAGKREKLRTRIMKKVSNVIRMGGGGGAAAATAAAAAPAVAASAPLPTATLAAPPHTVRASPRVSESGPYAPASVAMAAAASSSVAPPGMMSAQSTGTVVGLATSSQPLVDAAQGSSQYSQSSGPGQQPVAPPSAPVGAPSPSTSAPASALSLAQQHAQLAATAAAAAAAFAASQANANANASTNAAGNVAVGPGAAGAERSSGGRRAALGRGPFVPEFDSLPPGPTLSLVSGMGHGGVLSPVAELTNSGRNSSTAATPRTGSTAAAAADSPFPGGAAAASGPSRFAQAAGYADGSAHSDGAQSSATPLGTPFTAVSIASSVAAAAAGGPSTTGGSVGMPTARGATAATAAAAELAPELASAAKGSHTAAKGIILGLRLATDALLSLGRHDGLEADGGHHHQPGASARHGGTGSGPASGVVAALAAAGVAGGAGGAGSRGNSRLGTPQASLRHGGQVPGVGGVASLAAVLEMAESALANRAGGGGGGGTLSGRRERRSSLGQVGASGYGNMGASGYGDASATGYAPQPGGGGGGGGGMGEVVGGAAGWGGGGGGGVGSNAPSRNVSLRRGPLAEAAAGAAVGGPPTPSLLSPRGLDNPIASVPAQVGAAVQESYIGKRNAIESGAGRGPAACVLL